MEIDNYLSNCDPFQRDLLLLNIEYLAMHQLAGSFFFSNSYIVHVQYIRSSIHPDTHMLKLFACLPACLPHST